MKLLLFNGECWEIIDWCGNVIDHRYSKEYAKDRAGALGQDTMELTWEMLQTIRKKNGGN